MRSGIDPIAFDQEIWDESKATTFPPTDIVVAFHKDLENQAAEIFQFLQKYETSNDLKEDALRYMDGMVTSRHS